MLILGALTVATAVWCPSLGAPLLPLALLAFTISFFRDPTRQIPDDAGAIVAPADGKVVEIRTVAEPRFMKSDATRVAIFLSIFDVHVQRAPVAGVLKFVEYTPGKFLDARNPQAGTLNEARTVGIELPDGFRVTVRQIAGLIARRIVGWAGEGTKLAKGEHIGMIRFGSRVELYLPVGTEVVVQIGQHVNGGETVVARRQ